LDLESALFVTTHCNSRKLSVMQNFVYVCVL